MGIMMMACNASSTNHEDEHDHGHEIHVENMVSLTQSQMDAIDLKLVDIEDRNMNMDIQVNGTIELPPQHKANISPIMGGIVKKIYVIEGDKVKKGQVLLELDHSEEDARLIAAKATLVLNKQTLNRYNELKKSREISEDLVDQANAAVQIAKSDIAVLTTVITKKKLVAPFTAKVGIHTLEVGQYLDNNSQVLELVGVNDFTWIDFYLPQVYQELELGSMVNIKAMNQENTFQAKIIAIDPQLSRASRHLKYRAQIASSILSLKPNTLISVTAPVAEMTTLISVPDLAIKRDPFGNYVFLLEMDKEGAYRAKQVKVELGDRQANQVMILEGLTSGQLIASKGAFKLFPGMKVYVANAASIDAIAKL